MIEQSKLPRLNFLCYPTNSSCTLSCKYCPSNSRQCVPVALSVLLHTHQVTLII